MVSVSAAVRLPPRKGRGRPLLIDPIDYDLESKDSKDALCSLEEREREIHSGLPRAILGKDIMSSTVESQATSIKILYEFRLNSY